MAIFEFHLVAKNIPVRDTTVVFLDHIEKLIFNE